jgi:electron transport complex protein RnfG
MTKSYKLILVLTLTAILSGSLLAFLNLFTEPKISAYQDKVLQEALNSVLPHSNRIENKQLENQALYLGYDSHNKVSGVAFLAEGNGFQSKLRILVGMNATLSQIVKIKILEQKETPGLGTKIENDPTSKSSPNWFSKQFDQLNVKQAISYVKNKNPDKNSGEIMAITGATISSKAVVDIINAAINSTRALVQKNPSQGITPLAMEAESYLNDNNMESTINGLETLKKDGKIFYLRKNSRGKITEISFITSGAGFQSTIKIWVCVKPDFSTIQEMRILEQDETPDWGSRIIKDPENPKNETWFVDQFNGLKIAKLITIVQDSPDPAKGEVMAVSGATISSEAVIRILNDSLPSYRAIYFK